MTQYLFCLLIFMFAITSEAARTVKLILPVGSSSVRLVNPSTISVNYDVSCFDMSGTSLSSSTNQTLASKASTTIQAGTIDSGKCAASATPDHSDNDATGKKYYLCGGNFGSGSVNYANAASACGTGQEFCYPRPTANSSVTSACGAYWLKYEAGIKSGCGSYTAIASTDKPSMDDYWASEITLNNGTTSWIGGVSDGTSNKGAACCEASVLAGYCSVTINTSEAAAFLASPLFKGGAPF
ncbi:MAG: hypothetical protein AB7O96_06145 [Pseudobdellovibrionaceae bacterium]